MHSLLCANKQYKCFWQGFNLLGFIPACTAFRSFCNECSTSTIDEELHWMEVSSANVNLVVLNGLEVGVDLLGSWQNSLQNLRGLDFHLTSQMIVIGGFGRPEHCSSLVSKLSVVVPGLEYVTLYNLPVSQVSLDSCFTNIWVPCPGQRILFHSRCFLLQFCLL